MDRIGSGNHERAWNDPPKFAFDASGTGAPANPSGRRRLLNKRVPVPIGPSSGVPQAFAPLKPGDGPPVTSTAPSCPPTVGPPKCPPPSGQVCEVKPQNDNRTNEAEESRSSEAILDEVKASLDVRLGCLAKDIKESVHEEITRRLKVMENMWREGKLNPIIHKQMSKLSRALAEGNCDEAWTIHQCLIVDYTTLCSPWMIGIKTIISESRNQTKPKEDQLKEQVSDKDTAALNESNVDETSSLDISKITVREKEEDEESEKEKVAFME